MVRLSQKSVRESVWILFFHYSLIGCTDLWKVISKSEKCTEIKNKENINCVNQYSKEKSKLKYLKSSHHTRMPNHRDIMSIWSATERVCGNSANPFSYSILGDICFCSLNG